MSTQTLVPPPGNVHLKSLVSYSRALEGCDYGFFPGLEGPQKGGEMQGLVAERYIVFFQYLKVGGQTGQTPGGLRQQSIL